MISGQGTKSEDEIFDEAYQALLDLADEMNDQASKEEMFSMFADYISVRYSTDRPVSYWREHKQEIKNDLHLDASK